MAYPTINSMRLLVEPPLESLDELHLTEAHQYSIISLSQLCSRRRWSIELCLVAFRVSTDRSQQIQMGVFQVALQGYISQLEFQYSQGKMVELALESSCRRLWLFAADPFKDEWKKNGFVKWKKALRERLLESVGVRGIEMQENNSSRSLARDWIDNDDHQVSLLQYCQYVNLN